MNYKQIQIDNFFRYVAIPTQSDAKSKNLPSSHGQYELVKLLKSELEALGLEDILLQENAILTATLKGDKEMKSVGFCAHLDTVDVGLSPMIKPQILRFSGEALTLNEEKGIKIDPKEHPELLEYQNEEIIFSDGTSVLGADNKASIATIMTLLAYFKHEKVKHPDIFVCFLPDEEIGLRGANALDLKHFNPDFAYTIDCCKVGECVYETFNAGSALVQIEGVSAHPMNAKGILINPTLIAIDIANNFERLKTPENTEGYEGYIWIQEIHSNQLNATMLLNIRDHNKNKYELKKRYIQEVIALMRLRYPKAKIDLKLEDVYINIKDCMNEVNQGALDLLFFAFKRCDVKAECFPMRGGTDGSCLSAKGLFVPNFFTGAHNFHSAFEFLPLSSFYKSFEVARTICVCAKDF